MADIDFSKVAHDDVKGELVDLLKLTDSFKNADFEATNINALVNLMSYNSELFSYYINQIANEPYIDSSKLYKNINRISNNLEYYPIGKGNSLLEIVSNLSKDYSLANEEGYIEIPAYSKFISSKNTDTGDELVFTNTKPLLVQILQFGTRPVKEIDFSYNGIIQDGVLNTSKLKIEVTEERALYIISNDQIASVETKPINIVQSNNLSEFKTNIEYSLLLKFINDEWVIEVNSANTVALSNEIASFYISDDGDVLFQRTTSSSLISIGRLGYRNLDKVKLKGIGTTSRPDILSKLQMTIDRFSPTVQVMYNGEILSFDSQDNDVVISSDVIEGNYFRKGVDVYVTLVLTDRRSLNYGAKLVLKRFDELESSDVVLYELPLNDETFEEISNGVGDLKLSRNIFKSNEGSNNTIKTGSVFFNKGESRKRVTFDVPYNFGLQTATIPEDSNKDYSIKLSPEGNVKAFSLSKTTSGFIVEIENDSDYEGNIVWRTVSYGKEVVDEKIVNVNSISQLVNVDQGYTAIIQPNKNVNVWVSQVTEGLKIISDTSFLGEVDYLIIPNDSSISLNSFEKSSSVFIPRGSTDVEVKYDSPVVDNSYRIFLQPDSPVNVWVEGKTTNGFLLRVERDSDYEGIVTWQLHSGLLSGTIEFKGGELFDDYDVVNNILDISEKQQLGYVLQGEPQLSIINDGGFIDSSVNGLTLGYDSDLTINPGLSIVCERTDISYNNIRVFVKISTEWVEFIEYKNFTENINQDSKIFYVRINKNRNISIKFGNNDFRGIDVLDKKVAIIGLKTYGVEGNIGENVLLSEIEPSLNFNISNIDVNSVEDSLFSKLRIFSSNGATIDRVIKDHNNNVLTQDDINVIQIGQGIFGTEPEDVESIRKNAKSSYISQDRIVSNTDYRNKILGEFSDFIIDAQVFNYKEAEESGLITSEEVAKYYYNTIFIMAIPSFGSSFSVNQKNLIKTYIDDRMKKQSTIETVILEPTFISVDVVGSFRVAVDSSPFDIQNNIVKGVTDFFDRRKRQLGETIDVYNLKQGIDTNGISSLELKLYKDSNDKYSQVDYDIDIKYDEYQDRFQDIEDSNLKDRLNSELKNLIDKGLITLNQPLFDVENKEGKRTYPYSNDLSFGRFEFPILGDLSLERKV